MADILVRPRVEDDDPAIVSLANALDPEFPRLSVEEYRAHIDATPPGVSCYRFVAERTGEIVGHGVLLDMFWVEQPGSVSARVAVRPDLWGRGIGRRLYEQLLQAAGNSGVERLYAEVRDDRPRAHRFAAARGFRETGHVERMSRLDVRDVNLDGYGGLEDRLLRDGIHVSTLDKLDARDDDVLRAVYEVDMSTSRDVPASEVFHMSFDRWRAWFLDQPGVTPESIFVALQRDQPIGLAILGRQGADSAWNHGTGVERAYRGRGVARLLKLQSIHWARENGVAYLYTGNDADNPRIYEINVRLGYQPLPSTIEMVKDLKR